MARERMIGRTRRSKEIRGDFSARLRILEVTLLF